jgi:hypothetical protein
MKKYALELTDTEFKMIEKILNYQRRRKYKLLASRMPSYIYQRQEVLGVNCAGNIYPGR